MTSAARNAAIVGAVGAFLGIALAPAAVPLFHAVTSHGSFQQAFPWMYYTDGSLGYWLDAYTGRVPLGLTETGACIGLSILAIASVVALSSQIAPTREQKDGAFGSQTSVSSARAVVQSCDTWDGGMPERSGFVVGYAKRRYIITPAGRAVFCAPSGSFKSRGSVVPTLACVTRTGEGNVVVTDPSLELYCYAQRMLALGGYRVFLVDLENPFRGDRANFLLPLVRLHQQGFDYLVEERATEIGSMLFPECGSDQDAFTQPAAGLVAAVAYIVATSGKVPDDARHLYTVIRIILEGTTANSAAPLKRWIRGFGPEHPAVGMAATFLASSDRYEASILGTLHLGLKPFNTTAMRHLISGDGFDPDEFLESRSALFVHTLSPGMPGNKACSLLFAQLWAATVRNGQRRGSNRPTYYILDEAHSVPPFGLVTMMEQGRKYGVSIALYLQSLSGLDPYKTRKEDGKDSILANCDCKCLFRAGSVEDARYFEELSGKATYLSRSTSRSGSFWEFTPTTSVNYSERERPVWMAGDIMQRDPVTDGVLLFQNVTGHPGAMGKFEVPIKEMTEVPFMVDLLGTIGSRDYEARVISATIDSLDDWAAAEARQSNPVAWVPTFPAKSKGRKRAAATDAAKRDELTDDVELFGL